MATMAAASCSFSLLYRSAFSRRTTISFSSSSSSPLDKPSRSRRQPLQRSSPARTSSEEIGAVPQKRIPGRRKDERAYCSPNTTKDETGSTQSAVFKSLGAQKKDRKGSVYDLKEQQIYDTGDLQDASFLNAVVKVYCTHTAPDYSLPWQKQRQYTSTGSAFMIGDGKLLTNAHCVEHDTQVKVKRRGDDTKFVAKVLARGVECDIALLSVESEEFWKGAESLKFGRLPSLQDAVTVVGYPLGGDTISVTKGVVSRIEDLYTSNMIGGGVERNGLYQLTVNAHANSMARQDVDLWHRRLGHLGL